MSATGLDVFDTTLQETHHWLNDVMDAMGVPEERRDEDLRRRAYQALRCVLVTLRDRLPVDLAAALSAQLPLLLRGVFYEGFEPSKMPAAYREQGEFERRVAEYSHRHDLNPQEAVPLVFGVLNERLTEGLVHKIYEALPKPVRNRWPERQMAG
jgi:uncharacterized protein (DUF2267 family)